jgi:hypothetical protein
LWNRPGRPRALHAIAACRPVRPDGWRELKLDVESVAVAAGQVTALGGEAEVLDSPELRSAFAAAGAAPAAWKAPR